MRTALWGGFWLAIYVGVVLTPLIVLLLAPTPVGGGGVWWEIAIAFGFAGLVMMGVQFLLTARFRRATTPFGIDIIYYFHRYLAYVIVAVVLAHPVILVSVNPAHLSSLNPLTAPWEMTAGTMSVVLLLTLVATSAWRKRLRIPYEGWRIAHLLMGMGAVVLGFVHMGGIRYHTGTPAVAALWVIIGLSLAAVIFWVRVIKPWMLLHLPYRVTEVRPELGNAWALTVEPEGHAGFSFHPGQFAWVTFRHSPFAMQEHPFSIASSPVAGGRLQFTIKELGDFTRTVGQIRAGETAYVDGPYGAFSIDRYPQAAGYVFIAAGIGVAPMVSMLRTLADRRDARHHVLFAAHGRWDRVPIREEIAKLKTRLDLKVIYTLEEPPTVWTGERGWITREILDWHLPPERTRYEYFICGPVPMSQTMEGFLHDLGIPMANVHIELFDMV